MHFSQNIDEFRTTDSEGFRTHKTKCTFKQSPLKKISFSLFTKTILALIWYGIGNGLLKQTNYMTRDCQLDESIISTLRVIFHYSTLPKSNLLGLKIKLRLRENSTYVRSKTIQNKEKKT